MNHRALGFKENIARILCERIVRLFYLGKNQITVLMRILYLLYLLCIISSIHPHIIACIIEMLSVDESLI